MCKFKRLTITSCKLQVITLLYDHRTLTVHEVHKYHSVSHVPIVLFYCSRRVISWLHCALSYSKGQDLACYSQDSLSHLSGKQHHNSMYPQVKYSKCFFYILIQIHQHTLWRLYGERQLIVLTWISCNAFCCTQQKTQLKAGLSNKDIFISHQIRSRGRMASGLAVNSTMLSGPRFWLSLWWANFSIYFILSLVER